MRRQTGRGFCGTRTAWLPAALGALLPVLSMLPLQRAAAQQAASTAPAVSSVQADAQIASLLGQVESLLEQGHITSPADSNATAVFTRALVLYPSASPAGLRQMAAFPSILKSRADAARAEGHNDLGVQIEAFAEVVSEIISPHNTSAQTDGAASKQSGSAGVTADGAEPDAQRASATAPQTGAAMPGLGATDRAVPPGNGEPSHATVAASVPTATDATSPSTADAPSRTATDAASSSTASGAASPPTAIAATPSPTATDVASSSTASGAASPPTAIAATPPPTATDAAPPSTAVAAASPSTAISDPVPALPIAHPVSPTAWETSQTAASGGQLNAEVRKRSGGSQVASLSPAVPVPAASPDRVPATVERPRVPPASAAMVDALLKQGNAMLAIGDISAARLLFARAAESGSGEAALTLGDTYNSVFLAEHGVVGPLADATLAKHWYLKAADFGEPRAKERLARLGGDMHAEAQGSMNTR